MSPMNRLLPLLALLTMCTGLAAHAAVPVPRVFLAGDSTMANKPFDLPERGWGMALGGFLKETAMVQNHAVNGRSTKSFIDEGRWARLASELRSGDFVIIQFGHNDEKKENPKVYADSATSYRDNLRKFIRETREKGANPILATSICRRKFVDGKLVDTHGDYPDAVLAVGADEKVPVLDLEKATAKWLTETGDEPSRRFFMWIKPGEYPQIPDGRKDDTHLVDAGAYKVAELAVAEIRKQNLPLAEWLR